MLQIHQRLFEHSLYSEGFCIAGKIQNGREATHDCRCQGRLSIRAFVKLIWALCLLRWNGASLDDVLCNLLLL